MVVLREMREEEYPGLLSVFLLLMITVVEIAKNTMDTFRYSIELAKKDLHRCF